MEHIRFVWPRFPPLGFRFGTTVTSRSRIEAGCANNPDSTDGESPRERERESEGERETATEEGWRAKRSGLVVSWKTKVRPSRVEKRKATK